MGFQVGLSCKSAFLNLLRATSSSGKGFDLGFPTSQLQGPKYLWRAGICISLVAKGAKGMWHTSGLALDSTNFLSLPQLQLQHPTLCTRVSPWVQKFVSGNLEPAEMQCIPFRVGRWPIVPGCVQAPYETVSETTNERNF